MPFNVTLREVLALCGGAEAGAVQVGGPSGQMVGPDDFDRVICYDDLATGGSIMVFGPERSIVRAVRNFLDFFVEESCGYCTPCRVGTVLMQKRLCKLLAGKGETGDLEYLEELANSVKMSSRCGLGQTAGNPVLSTLKNFRAKYEEKISEPV